ncbi:TBC1 domain family member 15 isoform X7 [Neomonachus schauinslandi]|uniref:TBC1 domain family member 15 isoform X7 n=1 Tax=Neomonachus schauinslandi TaxID=29088 RepID=A0A2Y9G7X5_NEOSC|nr:TBC1 domain family member 15 isoform X7 [Neomonachus schauinslandi]
MAAESVVSGKIIYEQEGVYIHSSCGKTNDQDSLISGILRVLEKDAEVIVDWRPLDDALDSSSILYAGKDSSSVVEWTQAPKERGHRGSEHLNNYEAEWDMVNTVPSKKKPHTNEDAPSHRNGKSKWSFLFSLTDLKSIKQNREGMGWSYLVFCLKDDVVLPALHFHQGDSKLLIDSLEKYVVLCESPQDKRTLLVNCQNKSLSQSFENLLDEPAYGLIQKIKKDPYTATMVGFSKVTNYIFDSLRGSDPSTHQRPPSEMADFLSDAIPGLKINQQEEPGFEVITRIDLGERPIVQRREPVSLEEWTKNIDSEGKILNVDILMTYCMYDFDLGYVQGMSDLLSPLLYVMENEVDAFWCFASYMDQMHQNFEEQMQGMKTQLIQLSTLLRLLDSGFCSYLESQDSGYLYFCFRWLLIRFKREFSFLDILRLWEVMWTELPCKNFHLLLCCAILESEKQQIMEKHYGFNEILKHINELSMKIDVEDVLCKAEAISLQMVKCKELPQAVCEILGLQDSEVTTPDSDTGEDENVGMTSCPTSTFQSDSLPVLATSGARDDDPTQISVSPNVSRLTPS